MALGKLHLLVLHFPVALVLTVALADVIWLRWRKPIFQLAGYFCLLLGTLACIPTMATGLMLIDTLKFTPEEASLAETHETLGIMTVMVVVLAAVVRAWRKNKLSGMWACAYGLLIAGSVALVGVTAHYGGLLAFGKDYLSGIL